MQNGNKYLFRISPAGCGQITMPLECHGIFVSNFAYLYSLTLYKLWYAKRWRGFAEHQSGQSWSVSEIANNS